MFAQLGSIVFDARNSPTAMGLSEEENIVEHALIDTKPTLQRVGSKLDKLSLTLLFDISFCNPNDQIELLRSAKDVSEIMPFILANGLVIGDYVILKMTTDILHSSPDGFVLQAQVQLDLSEYFDPNREATQQVAAVARGFAMSQNLPPETVPVVVIETPESAAMAGVVDTNASGNAAADGLSSFGNTVDLYRPKADAILQNLLKMHDSLGSVLDLINNDPASERYSVTRDLALNIGVLLLLVADVTIEVQTLITSIDTGQSLDIPTAIVNLANKSTEVRLRTKNMLSSASALTALTLKK